MSYTCEDNIVLFIGNPREGDLVRVDTFQGQVCAFDEIWMLDLIGEYCLRENWIPTAGIAATAQENITETINVGIIGAHNWVIDERAKLDNFMQAIIAWHKGIKINNSIWLYHQMSGEEGMRRCLLYSLTSRDVATQLPKDNADAAIDMRLSIERHFCWENIENVGLTFPEFTFPYWGTIYTPNIGGVDFEIGTSPARIQLSQIGDLVRDPLTRRIIGTVWTGVKEDLGCGLDMWSPLWECETGIAQTAYAGANVVDATASAGLYRNVNFPAIGTAMTTQITMSLENAFPALPKSAYEQFRGDYIVLLRAKLENPNMIVPMTIRYGWLDGGRKIPVRQSPVVFTGESDWRLIEMGVISLPPDSGKQALSLSVGGGVVRYNNLSKYTIDVLAGLDAASGALGDLFLDALYLIPYEHNAKARYQGKFSPSFATAAVNNDALWIATHEDDTAEARYLYDDPAAPADAIDPISDYVLSTTDYFLPQKGSRIVWAVNSFDEVGGVYKNVNELDWELFAFYNIYPRWLTYRTG